MKECSDYQGFIKASIVKIYKKVITKYNHKFKFIIKKELK